MKHEYTDLTGDAVYDFLGTTAHEGWRLDRGRIMEPKTFTNGQARKTIEVIFVHDKAKPIKQTFNYKKLERML